MESKNIINQIPTLTKITKEYKVKYSNEEYSLKLGKTSATGFMIIILKGVKDDSNIYHIVEFCLNDLLDIDKTFWKYDNVDEIIKEVQEAFNEKLPVISVNKQGNFCVEFVMESYRSIDNIKFTLEKKFLEKEIISSRKNSEATVVDESLMKEFNQMKNEISKLRGEVNLLKVTIENKENALYEKQKILEEKLKNEQKNKEIINGKDDIISKLVKRVEVLEEMNKKFESFMNKK